MDAENLDVLRTKEYWENRYTNESVDTEFDWFKEYDDLAPWLERTIQHHHKILILGCGNSKLSYRLYQAGYRHILNVDFSETVISRMAARYGQDCPEMEWKVMDVRELKVDSCSIDVAIDKGTMDALLCSSGSVWSPPEEVVHDCKREVDEVLRVLKPGGYFMYISFGQPHFRIPHLQRAEWKNGVQTNVLGDGGIIQYFLYEMRKME